MVSFCGVRCRKHLRPVNFSTPGEFILHCNTKLRMKFISALVIQQTEVILVQDRYLLEKVVRSKGLDTVHKIKIEKKTE